MLARTGRTRKILPIPRPGTIVRFRQHTNRNPRNHRDTVGSARPGYRAEFLHGRRELRAAQRLRHQVFAGEYGATTSGGPGLDRDRFDPHCLHLGVRDERSGHLAGYTRVLPDDRLDRTGGFYSADEFELDMVDRLPGRVAELGRTCIHPDHRGGAVVGVLWSRLARYLLESDIRYLVGCASVALEGDYDTGAIIDRVRSWHWTDPAFRVTPRRAAPAVPPAGEDEEILPPLFKAYLRMGARVCGEPCWDPDFRCLDFFVLMDLKELSERYVRRFLRPLEQAV